MSKKKLYILKRSTKRIVASIEVEEAEVADVRKGIEKIFKRLLGCDDYVVKKQAP